MADTQDVTHKNTSNTTITPDVQKLHDLVSDLLTVPEDLEIQRFLDEKGVLLTIHVHAKDMGNVIGRQGIMIESFRVYMRAWGKSHDMNIRLEALEPDGSLHASRNSSEANSIDQDVEGLIAG